MRVRHRLVLALLLFAVFGLLAGRLRVTADLSRLMPEEGEFATAFWYLERFDVSDTLLVEVDGSGVPRATLIEAVDALGTRLEADPAIATVRYRVDLGDVRAMQEAVAPHATSLIPRDQLEERLSPEGLREVLGAQVVRLAGPGGFLQERAFLADPLNLTGLALAQLEGLHLFRIEVVDGHFLHESGERAVLFVEPRLSSMAVGPDAPLVAHLEEVFAGSPLPVTWLGSHRIAEDAARSMRDDVRLAGTFGVGLLLLLFVVGFRSFRPVAGALGPLVLVIAATAAVAGLIRPIHGINLGFAGALLGLSLDYWIHLYVAAAARGIPDGFRERLAVAREAFREL
ncbi:MAG: hypothetical protein JRI25_27495, partial [Deltaproteobacteria bacterium]|nr:hypothetical protein [Deltaproteobacteria bacterium]